MVLRVQTQEDSELFYVIPNLRSDISFSHNESCLTFQHFVNMNQIYGPTQENATLVFLTGHHIVTESHFIYQYYQLEYTNLAMIGTSKYAIIYNIKLILMNVQQLLIKNLTLTNGHFFIHMIQEKSYLSLISITLIDNVLGIVHASSAHLNDCEFSSGTSQLIMHESKVVLSGNSKFFNNYNSALVAYSSTIILSGTVAFINNTGIRGGAMALYLSEVCLDGGLNISFINNSAKETGGAIHIEPDMTHPLSCSVCFYNIQDQFAKSVFYYSENHAKFGGDNIYGTSLAFCERLWYDVIHYFPSNVSMSSVSSDPTQVCLCNSNGRPQCENLMCPIH